MSEFARTAEALRVYNADLPRLNKMPLHTQEQIGAWYAATDEADRLVREAFYEDSKSYNTREQVFAMSVLEIQIVVNGVNRSGNS